MSAPTLTVYRVSKVSILSFELSFGLLFVLFQELSKVPALSLKGQEYIELH